MKIVTDLFDGTIVVDEDMVTSFVIENQRMFRAFLTELHAELNGDDTGFVLSDDDRIIKVSAKAEIISTFVPFFINEKRLLNKICSMVEKEALSEEYFGDTMKLLAELERYMGRLTDALPCSVSFDTITVSSLVKMCGISIDDDSESEIERVFNHLMLVRELLGDKLFVLVNMRTYFDDDDMQRFINTVVVHKLYVLLIDGYAYDKLDNMRQVVLDRDLCLI